MRALRARMLVGLRAPSTKQLVITPKLAGASGKPASAPPGDRRYPPARRPSAAAPARPRRSLRSASVEAGGEASAFPLASGERRRMVGVDRLELSTFRLSSECSSQLSYTPGAKERVVRLVRYPRSARALTRSPHFVSLASGLTEPAARTERADVAERSEATSRVEVVDPTGVEPAASWLQTRRSPIELRALLRTIRELCFGGQALLRVLRLEIKERRLYINGPINGVNRFFHRNAAGAGKIPRRERNLVPFPRRKCPDVEEERSSTRIRGEPGDLGADSGF